MIIVPSFKYLMCNTQVHTYKAATPKLSCHLLNISFFSFPVPAGHGIVFSRKIFVYCQISVNTPVLGEHGYKDGRVTVACTKYSRTCLSGNRAYSWTCLESLQVWSLYFWFLIAYRLVFCHLLLPTLLPHPIWNLLALNGQICSQVEWLISR